MQPKTQSKIDSNNSNGLKYSTVWRWHFYAGLFCMPFILWLASTGLIYLFKPQIDQYFDRPYNHIALHGQLQPASSQVVAALNAVPNSVFSAYEIAPNPNAAARVLVAQNDQIYRVYINPENLNILNIINQNDVFTRKIFLLHGELMLGDNGSRLVELAASWTIIMIITGIFLWSAKGGKFQFAGMIYPRINRTDRAFWKDIHTTLGFWLSIFTLFLIISGLPWSASWGGMLKTVRQWAAPTAIQQDWTVSSKQESHHQQKLFERIKENNQEHAQHHMNMNMNMNMSKPVFDAQQGQMLNKIVAQAANYNLQYPVQIQPKINQMQSWNISSQTQNRPQRTKIIFDENANPVKTESFSSKPFIDRLIGYGVAIHEGQMFGWINTALGVFTALGLILLSISGCIMWLRRKPQHVLGAPPIVLNQQLSFGIKITVIFFGIFLPLLGISLILVLLLERFVFTKIKPLANFLGLNNKIAN